MKSIEKEGVQKREKVGKIARDLQLKTPDTVRAVDLGREMLEQYGDNVIECINRGKKELAKSFYVVVLTKKERLLSNVLRNYFFFRESCPTPEYDQSVFYYDYKSEEIDHMWTVPSKDVCIYLKTNARFVDPSEWKLLEYVLKFSNGDLYKISKKLNNERPGSNILDK